MAIIKLEGCSDFIGQTFSFDKISIPNSYLFVQRDFNHRETYTPDSTGMSLQGSSCHVSQVETALLQRFIIFIAELFLS